MGVGVGVYISVKVGLHEWVGVVMSSPIPTTERNYTT